MKRDLHKEVRVIYRACRSLYGKEKTQDECLRIFKVLYPERLRIERSESERERLSENVPFEIQKITKSWKPQKRLKQLIERVESLVGLPFDYERKELLALIDDLLPVVMRIRKLTPRECGRLQDVSDEDIDKIEASGISKSAMYKLYGNSITVSPLFYILKKMFVDTDIEKSRGMQLTLF